jgi:hypothetical protein
MTVSRRFLLLAVLVVVIVTSIAVFNLSKPAGAVTLSGADEVTFRWSGQTEGETITIDPKSTRAVGDFAIPSFNRFSMARGIDEALTRLGSVPMLPTLLPEDLIYADVYVGPDVIIAYSYTSTKDFTFSDMGIEISPAPKKVPTPEEIRVYLKPPLQLVQVGKIWVILNPEANIRGERGFYACFCNENLYYQVSAKPPLTAEGLMKIIESMETPN